MSETITNPNDSRASPLASRGRRLLTSHRHAARPTTPLPPAMPPESHDRAVQGHMARTKRRLLPKARGPARTDDARPCAHPRQHPFSRRGKPGLNRRGLRRIANTGSQSARPGCGCRAVASGSMTHPCTHSIVCSAPADARGRHSPLSLLLWSHKWVTAARSPRAGGMGPASRPVPRRPRATPTVARLVSGHPRRI